MRKMLILLALAMLTVSSTGCSRCRGLFRRGSPCGGTRLAAPPMLGGAIPLGAPVGLRQAVPQGIITQPAAPMICEPCPTDCVPCDSGYIGGETSYIDGTSGDCGCQSSTGEYIGGYIEGGTPISGIESSSIPLGSGTNSDPSPVHGNQP